MLWDEVFRVGSWEDPEVVSGWCGYSGNGVCDWFRV